MSATMTTVPDIRPVERDADVTACFPLMHQLRPHLASPQEFITR